MPVVVAVHRMLVGVAAGLRIHFLAADSPRTGAAVERKPLDEEDNRKVAELVADIEGAGDDQGTPAVVEPHTHFAAAHHRTRADAPAQEFHKLQWEEVHIPAADNLAVLAVPAADNLAVPVADNLAAGLAVADNNSLLCKDAGQGCCVCH